MTDSFAALGEPRRPWLDGEALKESFLQFSTAVHPDRFHGVAEVERLAAGQRYTELNSAFQQLREPRNRLLHLIELESGARPPDIQRIPPGTMDVFVEVGQACRDVDAFLARRGAVTSPMLKVKLFAEGMDLVEKVNGLQAKVRELGSRLDGELQGMNPAWEKAPPVGSPDRIAALPLGRLEEIYRVLSYVARWTDQLQDRVVQLATP